MARRPISQRALRVRLELLLEQITPQLASAFRGSIDEITSNVSLQRLVDAIERRDFEAAIRELYIEPAAFRPLGREIQAAYEGGGNAVANGLTTDARRHGVAFVIRFDPGKWRAQYWLRTHSSMLFDALLADQREAIRAALVSGMESGRGPRQVALDIVGRTDRRLGRRVGGIIGLTSTQERWAATAYHELTSGDAALMRNYLTRARRDHRHDAMVLRAIKAGVPLSAADASRLADRYRARLLDLRGTVIAQHEGMAALHVAQHENYLQLVESGRAQEQDITRTWESAKDKRVRATHRHDTGMDGQIVGLNEPFISPSGARLMYPHDPLAPPAETLSCRCWASYRVDWIGILARQHQARAA